jgi:hypothetical protein
MATIQIEAQISADQLIRAVEQLPSDELGAFVEQVLALRARRAAPQLDQQETTLLLQINEQFAPDEQRRYDELVAKRQDETISPEELRELIRLTDEREQRNVERLAALTELARLRGVTLAALMSALGIAARPYV